MAYIHKFKYKDDYFVLDVNSGAIHVVDKLVYEMIGENGLESRNYYIDKYKSVADENTINDCYDELNELKENGQLYEEDLGKGIIKKYENEPSYVKSLCLNIAHDCNLRCKYCFADGEGYDQQKILMSYEVAKQSIDFLISKSGTTRTNLEVDFFGGEPLMNMDVVKKTVEYARSIEKQHNKKFRFTMTTNSVLLDEETRIYLDKNMINIVLSIDGRKEVHDRIRVTKTGKGSYDMILPKIRKMVDMRHKSGKQYYIRGTFTAQNLDFSKDIQNFIDLGFKEISIEPAVLPADNKLAIKEEHLEKICEEYEKIVDELIENKDVLFYHFNVDLNGGPCIYKKITGCGAGFDYIAVTPEGEVYPCHQFVGNKDFLLGNVFDGEMNQEIASKFKCAHLYNKPECKECWARFFCSGGCQANHYNFNGDFKIPYSIACKMAKKRVECAIALQYYRRNNVAKEN